MQNYLSDKKSESKNTFSIIQGESMKDNRRFFFASILEIFSWNLFCYFIFSIILLHGKYKDITKSVEYSQLFSACTVITV